MSLTQRERDELNAMPEREYVEMELEYAKDRVAYWENQLKDL